MSTCMYYTGVDPRTMEPIYVARDPHEKAMQRALIQYRKPENYKLVREALKRAGREDLIGYGKNCLIRPVPPRPGKRNAATKRKGQQAPGRSKDSKRGHGDSRKGFAGGKHAGGRGPSGAAPHGRNRAAQGREGARGGRRR